MIPEPQVVSRSWMFVYARPRRMGWPTLVRTGWTKDSGEVVRQTLRIAPERLRIMVRQQGEDAPWVDTISVTGHWASNGKPVIGEKVHHDARPGLALAVYADGNVRELMEDAVRRAAEEVSAAGLEQR